MIMERKGIGKCGGGAYAFKARLGAYGGELSATLDNILQTSPTVGMDMDIGHFIVIR